MGVVRTCLLGLAAGCCVALLLAMLPFIFGAIAIAILLVVINELVDG